MPYLPITLPSRGLHIDSAYSTLPPGFTLDSLNVLPYDAYKGKQRLGQRRALLGAFQFNTIPTALTREVQAIVRADAYVSEFATTILRQRCIVVAGGEVYIIDPGITTPVAATYAASTSKLNSTGDISVAIFGNYAYFADGKKYRRMNITTASSAATVEFWGTVLSSVTVVSSAGVFQCTAANLTVGQPITVTGTFPAGVGITGYSFHETFYVRSIISTSPYQFDLTRTLSSPTPGAAIATTVGTGLTTGVTFITSGPEMTIKPSSTASSIGTAKAEAGERASLLVRFGGRLALSGFTPSPNNWFLSKINDVDDWVPGSTPDDAVAGNLSTKFSIPGEPIIALIPMAESGLLFAGRHTMTYLSADPVFDTQARMIELSRSVGIVSAKAWCVSDSQTVYIMAQDGLYRVRPNEFQVTQSGRITGGRLDSFFQSQKFDKLNCSLGFDPEIQNIYCIMSRIDLPSSSTHLVYSQATDSFWAIRTGWTDFQAPSCIGEFPFGDARSPVLALGSTSGYLGWFDRNLTSGVDGQAATGYKGAGSPFVVDNDEAAAQKIVSSLTIGPVVSPNLSQVMLRDMRVELTMDEPQEVGDFNTPNVRLTGPFLSILSGQTAEEAIGEAIVNVTVTYDPSFPAVVLDGGVPFDSRTNLLLRSQELTTTPWGLGNTTLFIPNNVLAPDGTLTAETLIWNNGAPVRNAYTAQSLAISPTTAYTFSVWIKSIGSTAKTDIFIASLDASNVRRYLVAQFSEQTLQSSVIINSGNIWTNVSTRVTSYPNNWWRVEVTGTSPSDTVTGQVAILNGQTGNGVIGAAVWGAQLEVAPAATAYIVTTSAAATAYIWDAESPYEFGLQNPSSPSFTEGIDNAYPQSIAPHTYTTLDTLITDSTVRTYAFGDNRIYNTGVAPSNAWKIQNQVDSSTIATLFTRDESLPDTSLDTPGGVYVYENATALPLPNLPGSSPSPRVVVSSGTYTNTNSIQIGELQSGRNDALRCRIRDQAVFARIDSYGVPWAIERMAALIDPMQHTKNVKGSY